MARILVIEDETDIRQVLEYNLRQAGYDVVGVDRGNAGLALARERPPELVLLDLMLPDVSGLDVCRAMKADARLRQVAVIMLTAKGSEIDRIVGLELGADDYVTKPFSVREVLLRVQAVLRRAPHEEFVEVESATFGCLRIDHTAHRVWVDDQEVVLTALEMRLLWTLYRRRGRVQSRGSLLDDVWAADPENNTRTVDTHVKRLREKLGAASDYIETVRGVGYRFADEPGAGS
jgi:two-component system phosphate regulon response regulator PhoB